jgi:hypothetical protein
LYKILFKPKIKIMKKLLMMLVFALLTIAVYAQEPGNDEWWRQIRSLGCALNETLEQCKARIWRNKNEKERFEDSVKRERDFENNKRAREEWAKEKERRDKLTPEERMKEDEKRRLGFEADKKKKTEDGIDFLAGAIYSNKTGNYPNYNPVLGMLIGVQTQVISISDYIGLGFGIIYSMQGGKYESSDYIPGGNYSTTSRTSRLNYLNFPVLLRYRKAINGFFAEAGLQPGLLLSAKDKGSTTTDIKEELNKFDVGIPVGVGYKFKNKFGVGLRFTPGLINVNKDKQYKNRNMVTSFRASYSL